MPSIEAYLRLVAMVNDKIRPHDSAAVVEARESAEASTAQLGCTPICTHQHAVRSPAEAYMGMLYRVTEVDRQRKRDHVVLDGRYSTAITVLTERQNDERLAAMEVEAMVGDHRWVDALELPEHPRPPRGAPIRRLLGHLLRLWWRGLRARVRPAKRPALAEGSGSGNADLQRAEAKAAEQRRRIEHLKSIRPPSSPTAVTPPKSGRRRD